MLKFIKRFIKNYKKRIKSSQKQEMLINNIYSEITALKLKEIIKQLQKTDKNLLIQMLLGLKINDDADVHFYYDSLQQYKNSLAKIG